DVKQWLCLPPCNCLRRYLSVRNTSGYFCDNQAGRAPLGVAKITFPPFSYMLSIISSNHSKLYFPSSGSTAAQEKIPTEKAFACANFMNLRSSANTSGRFNHCSGL